MRSLMLDYEQSFSWSVEQNARDTQITTRVSGGARRGLDARARVDSPH